MNDFRIELESPERLFRPGEEIRGRVSWWLESEPEWVELRLGWVASGEGVPNMGIAAGDSFESPDAGDERSFSFKAPAGPESFRGELISLAWFLELHSYGRDDAGASVEIAISRTGEVRDLRGKPEMEEIVAENADETGSAPADSGPGRP